MGTEVRSVIQVIIHEKVETMASCDRPVAAMFYRTAILIVWSQVEKYLADRRFKYSVRNTPQDNFF